MVKTMVGRGTPAQRLTNQVVLMSYQMIGSGKWNACPSTDMGQICAGALQFQTRFCYAMLIQKRLSQTNSSTIFDPCQVKLSLKMHKIINYH